MPEHEIEGAEVLKDTSDHDAIAHEASGAMGDVLLEVDHVTLRFGGVVALNDVNFEIRRGRDPRPDRSQRRRQDHLLQRDDRRLHAHGRHDPVQGPGDRGHQAAQDQPAGHRPDVPEHPALPGDVGAGERHGRVPTPATRRACSGRCSVPTGSADLRGGAAGAAAFRRSFAKVFGISRAHPGGAGRRRRSMELLRFVGIADRAHEVARNLPYGYQRRLEIARALATEPKLLCLDEPAAGFNPAEKEDLMDLIRQIRDLGHTVLLIEHDMRLVMGVTDRIVVLEFGQKIAEGTAGRGRPQPEGHRRLPGRARRCCLRSRTPCSATARSRRCTASACTSTRARSSSLIGANGAGKTSTMRALSGRARALRPGQIVFDGEDVTKLRADQRVRKGLVLSARGPRHLPRHDGHREPRHGRLHPQGQGRHRGGLRPGLRPLPADAGAAQAGRRHAVRWRAADAGHRPGPDVAAQAAHARRAVDGPGARC